MKVRPGALASLLVGGSLAVTGCGTVIGPEIPDRPLSGTFNGEGWTFVSGSTDLFPPDANKYLSTLRDRESKACDATGMDDVLIVNIPFKPATYDLGPDLDVVFKSGDEEWISTTGIIDVQEVTPDTIRGGLHAIHDSDPNFEVAGHFEVAICDIQ